MRSYIFTERERSILQAFASGSNVDMTEVSKILYRFKMYKQLPIDIDLFLRIRSIAKPETANPT